MIRFDDGLRMAIYEAIISCGTNVMLCSAVIRRVNAEIGLSNIITLRRPPTSTEALKKLRDLVLKSRADCV